MIVTLSDGWREWYTETMGLDLGKFVSSPHRLNSLQGLKSHTGVIILG